MQRCVQESNPRRLRCHTLPHIYISQRKLQMSDQKLPKNAPQRGHGFSLPVMYVFYHSLHFHKVLHEVIKLYTRYTHEYTRWSAPKVTLRGLSNETLRCTTAKGDLLTCFIIPLMS